MSVYKTRLNFEFLENDDFDILNIKLGGRRTFNSPSDGWSLISHNNLNITGKMIKVNINKSIYNILKKQNADSGFLTDNKWSEEYGFLIAYLNRLKRPYKIFFVDSI